MDGDWLQGGDPGKKFTAVVLRSTVVASQATQLINSAAVIVGQHLLRRYCQLLVPPHGLNFDLIHWPSWMLPRSCSACSRKRWRPSSCPRYRSSNCCQRRALAAAMVASAV